MRKARHPECFFPRKFLKFFSKLRSVVQARRASRRESPIRELQAVAKMAAVKVTGITETITEQQLREFFSYSGEVTSVELMQEAVGARIAVVRFADESALETALLLSGATIVSGGASDLEACRAFRVICAHQHLGRSVNCPCNALRACMLLQRWFARSGSVQTACALPTKPVSSAAKRIPRAK